jgi:uncharacterized protein (DUF169 family)
MEPLRSDLSIFNKFNFKRKPVGVKFLLMKPDGIGKLERNMSFCEMLKEAQEANPFYAVKEHFECVGPILMGMVEKDPLFESGQMGPRLDIFEEARSNQRLYQYIPRLERNTVNYVAFSSLDKLSFEPDVLILAVDDIQLEIILRAYSFSTGKMWDSKGTPVMACAWLYLYPYVSRELNFILTNVSHGMRAKQVFPEGLILVSIPYDLLPMIMENLKKIEWLPSMYTEGKEAHDRKFREVITEVTQQLQEQQSKE